LIIKINNQSLNVDNYYNLLSKTDQTITFGAIDSQNQITPVLPVVNLKAEVLNVDPLYFKTIFEYESKKIGYLVYNAFVDEYDNNLIEAFTDFKANQITDLILDLRYNTGGSINTATLLASMIGPQSIAGKTMIRSIYNPQLTEIFRFYHSDKPQIFEEKFKTTEQNLNLQNLYVLTTQNTASASEMIIYSLWPYMNVVQIGRETRGKYYGSTVYLLPDEENGPWAIMPIIMRSQNADNSIDYTKGLVPQVEMADDFDHQLGDPAEKLLAHALMLATGKQTPQAITQSATKKASLLKNARSLILDNNLNGDIKSTMWTQLPVIE
jgi:carboxyl-terminal processing protease